jgi:hypothetical protein
MFSGVLRLGRNINRPKPWTLVPKIYNTDMKTKLVWTWNPKGLKMNDKLPKFSQKGANNDQTGTKREPKWATNLTKTLPPEQGWKRDDTAGAQYIFVGSYFVTQSIIYLWKFISKPNNDKY